MDARDGIHWVLWSATIGMESTVTARVEAARAGGFECVTVAPVDVVREAEQGTPPEELGRRLHDLGLDVVMDPVMDWHGVDTMAGSPYAGYDVDDLLRMCAALEVAAISVIGPFTADAVSVDQVTGAFVAFCDRAADVGAQVQLEFMPLSAITDIETAWGIVETADRDNAGIVFDTWHFFRGNPDYAALARVPGARIFGVQVSDALVEVQGSIGEDTFNRRLPGDGELDLARVVAALDRMGALRRVGPEVLSPATAAMDPIEAARLAKDRVQELITRVRTEPTAHA